MVVRDRAEIRKLYILVKTDQHLANMNGSGGSKDQTCSGNLGVL